MQTKAFMARFGGTVTDDERKRPPKNHDVSKCARKIDIPIELSSPPIGSPRMRRNASPHMM
jgi:hypothetical protein